MLPIVILYTTKCNTFRQIPIVKIISTILTTKKGQPFGETDLNFFFLIKRLLPKSSASGAGGFRQKNTLQSFKEEFYGLW
jgi:hypothetical protein